MGITGRLGTMSLPDLLQWLAANGSTGTLELSNGRVEKRIFFEHGQIVSSASSDPREYLGHFLVSHRFITEAQLASAVHQQEERHALLGRILVDQRLISPEDLDRMLVLKAEEGIFDLFSWTDGDFRFVDGMLPSHEMVPISLNVTGLLLEGMQRLDEWSQIREVVPNVHAVPVRMRPDLEHHPDLDERERAVLALIDDDRSIEDLCLESHSSEYFVARTVADAAGRGDVKVVRARVVEREMSADGVARGAGELVAEARRHLEANRLELALRHLRAATSLEPHNHELRNEVRELEGQLRERISAAGVAPEATPVLVRPLSELAGAGLSPEEGFVLSRVDGTTNLASIVKISPLPEIEALTVFWKLVATGHVRLVGRR